MQEKLDQLKKVIGRAVDMERAASVLEWDQETYMPPGGGQARADQTATLRSTFHEIFASDEVGKLLDELEKEAAGLDYDSDEASLIRVLRREHERRVRVPLELAEELARTASLAQQVWQKARANNDFKSFEPLLAKTVELKHRWAECFKPYENIYDPLLDYYEPGITYRQIDTVFSALKPPLVKLVKDITTHLDAVDGSLLSQPFEPEGQMTFGREVIAALGYDFERGRIDFSAHPFTIHFGRDDVRITTRIVEGIGSSALMSTIHEAGHAMYEQGTSPTLYRTWLDQGASMSVHESQSRFYENIIGRSRPFWRYWYPRLQAIFPAQLGKVDMETFYRALNRVQPSLIRVEADEVTYGLHVILRFELENDLMNGRVSVSDLPKEWNARMEAYLGVVPSTDAEGVLQDVHWSVGYIGYFPDYLLGSIFSVQLWEQMLKERPSVPAEIEAGQYSAILDWLREKIHRHGMKFTLPELSQRITGGPLRWEPYMHYLQTKYGEIYGL
jgi:carboxypeptidase Taq